MCTWCLNKTTRYKLRYLDRDKLLHCSPCGPGPFVPRAASTAIAVLQLTAGIGKDYQDLEKHPDNIGMKDRGPVMLLLQAGVTAAARVCARTHFSSFPL